jgi:ABC-type transporter Mla maintaining outer membrane lipid asymmetry permease subunit MlaE
VAFFVEIRPLVAGLLMVGTNGASIGAGLADMPVTGQIDAIDVLSTD